MKTENCTKCGAPRDETFPRSGNKCLECTRAYYRERGAARRRADPEKANAALRADYAKDPQKWKARHEAWLANGGREKKAAITAEWKRRNRDRLRAIEAKRRAAALSGGVHTIEDVRAQMEAQNGLCFYCSEPLTKYHVEHKTPICRGGSNGPENIVCACPPCNANKGRLTADEYFAKRAA